MDEKAPDSPRAYSVPLIDGERLRVDQRLGGEQWDDRDRDTLLTLAGVAGDVLRSPNSSLDCAPSRTRRARA